MRLPPAGIFISTERRADFRGVGGRLFQKHHSIGFWQAWRSIVDQRLSFLFATVHPLVRCLRSYNGYLARLQATVANVNETGRCKVR
jgi:hypothetical protein